MSVGKRDYLSRLQTSLAFLCCGEIVKNSNGHVDNVKYRFA